MTPQCLNTEHYTNFKNDDVRYITDLDFLRH